MKKIIWVGKGFMGSYAERAFPGRCRAYRSNTNDGRMKEALQDAKGMVFSTWMTNVDSWELNEKKNKKFCMRILRRYIKMANDAKVPFLFLSTYHVFDGQSPRKMTENASTNPVNKYGLWKVKGELETLELANEPVVMRIGDPYGGIREKKFFQDLYHRAAIDLWCQPIHVYDVVWSAVQLMVKPRRLQLYHVLGDDFLSKFEFVHKFNYDVRPCFEVDLGLKAKRPHYPHLSTSKFDNEFGSLHQKIDVDSYARLR